MLIQMFTRSENQLETTEYNDKVVIKIDGQTVFEVHDGETDDNNLNVNFRPVYSIPELLEKVYNAGKSGEEVHIEIKDIEE